MPEVEMYTKAMCPFCARAKALFKKKGVKVTMALDRRGGLDPLLGL